MKRVFKYFLLPALILALFSCNQEETREEKEKQLENYRKEFAEIKAKITDLENELKSDSSYSDAQMSYVKVEVKEIHPERFEHFIEVIGSVEAVNEAYISPETPGRVKTITIDEGDRVIKGQVLARLNTDVTQSAIEGLEARLELAKVVFEKQERLWNKNIGSEIEYLKAKNDKETLESELEATRAQLEMAVITSPITGVVEEVMQQVGELASPGQPMMRVINMDKLYINSDISESHLPALNINEKVFVSFPTWPGLEMQPPIHRIGSAIHPLNRTVTVSVEVKNTPDHKLKPNLLANLRFMDFESDSALVVPSICIKQDINGPYLYRIAKKDGSKLAEKVYISMGLVYKNQTIITEGLKPGDRVIVEGYNLVTDQSEVRL